MMARTVASRPLAGQGVVFGAVLRDWRACAAGRTYVLPEHGLLDAMMWFDGAEDDQPAWVGRFFACLNGVRAA